MSNKPTIDITSIIAKLQRIHNEQDYSQLYEAIDELNQLHSTIAPHPTSYDKADILYHFSSEALVVIQDYKIIDCTPTYSKISGFECHELKDKSFFSTVHPSSINDMSNLFEIGKTGSLHYKGVSKNGDIYFANISINKTTLKNSAFFVLIQDITNQKKMEQQLRESESMFRNLANITSVAIMLYQGDKWIYANPAAEKISGYSAQELKKMNYWDFVAPEYKEMIKNRGKQRQKGDDVPSGYEFKITTKDGIEKWVFLDGKLSIYNSKPAGLISIIDISNIKQAEINLKQKNKALIETEEELKTTNQQLNILNKKLLQQNSKLKVAKDRAEESDRLKSAFLANMSHEIRTPMNAIMGFAEILAETDIDSKRQRDYGEIIHSRSQYLLQIINDIIDISKIEANLLNIYKTKFNINELLLDLCRTFNAVLKNKQKEHVKLIVQNPTTEKEDTTIYSDKQRLTQILTNLIGNAVKFTDEGSITIGYEMKDAETALFFVRDTGSGISHDDAEKIFDRFVMAKNAIDDKHQGTGLGLAISKSLVELLGGRLWLEKTSSGGTTFCFTISLKQLSSK
ncbi:MAG: PAS domain S-box protein [Salinivirgaceae bacterium]|jgi:PAS domain S-box-containing protein|nr:PAS domain S-box protein [Salinivirgaceae bacterium]